MVAHVLKMAMDDEDVVETIKHAVDMEDKEAKKSPDVSAQKRNAGNQAFQRMKDQEALHL